jgi:hypothetical protein
MHRSLIIVAFVLLAASAQLTAQHGGGHASAGGHAGSAFHGGFAGHSSGGFNGSHSGSSFAPRSYARAPSSRSSFHSYPRGYNGSTSVRIRTYGYGNCYGYGCRGRYGYGYPWGYAGYYDPYWWWNSGSSYDQEQQYQTGLANEMNAQSLNEQRMRAQGDQDLYARSAPPPPHQEERTEAAPATVLVFRDEHKQEVQNYAIVGQTLWNFNPQHTQKIPLSELDIPATTKANDERGVDFHLPVAREGQ